MAASQHPETEDRPLNTDRIVVLGTTGAGKTTLAAEIARVLDMPHFELDYYRFRPNWVETPNDEFRESVREALRGDRWVADGNYGLARDVIWPRATLLVWLDFPIYVVMWRLFWRTIGRGVFRKKLWHGNREKLWWHFVTRDSLFLWALKTHWFRRRQIPSQLARPEHGHLELVHLRSPKATRAWLRGLAG
ncbi:MAG: AAA family ATPase [Chloroflexota bacterium]|nr:AAA family ATPase [Chloroflexota bacterium]